jgi:hypothetical protein
MLAPAAGVRYCPVVDGIEELHHWRVAARRVHDDDMAPVAVNLLHHRAQMSGCCRRWCRLGYLCLPRDGSGCLPFNHRRDVHRRANKAREATHALMPREDSVLCLHICAIFPEIAAPTCDSSKVPSSAAVHSACAATIIITNLRRNRRPGC